MREEVRSSSAAPADPTPRSASPPATPVASSAGPSSPPAQANAVTIDWLGSEQLPKVGPSSLAAQPSLSTNAVGAAMDFSQPSCRPWERGDLLHRLATFKPSTWASKPKAASSLACAQRGWVNIDMDKIECDSCGAHLIFTALTSWSPAEVANAGEAFAEQLDASHQTDCPWRGNSCADSLVQLHFTPSALLGAMNGENDCETGLPEFDPIKHHSVCCPWVNGYVAAACSINTGSSTNSSSFCGWQLTVDALETVQSLGKDQNQAMRSDSAASLYKDDHVASSHKLPKRPKHSKC